VGTCLASHCPETALVYPPISPSLRSNGSTRYSILFYRVTSRTHCVNMIRHRGSPTASHKRGIRKGRRLSGCSVGRATGLQTGQSGFNFRQRQRLFFHDVQAGSGAHKSSLLFSGLKRQGREAGDSPPAVCREGIPPFLHTFSLCGV
jgi:hypothetical protein